MRSQLRPLSDRDVFAEFDRAYGVSGWRTPGSLRLRTPTPDRRRDPDEPAWWHGDEEASGSFLAAVGVRL